MPRDFKDRPTVGGADVALLSEVSGATRVVLATDQTNSTVTLADVTGLSFSVAASTLYRFTFYIVYDSGAIATGALFSLTGPANNLLSFSADYAGGATGAQTRNMNAYNGGTAATSSAFTSSNLAVMRGLVRPTANGTMQLRFASEVAASVITVRSGSLVEVS